MVSENIDNEWLAAETYTSIVRRGLEEVLKINTSLMDCLSV